MQALGGHVWHGVKIRVTSWAWVGLLIASLAAAQPHDPLRPLVRQSAGLFAGSLHYNLFRSDLRFSALGSADWDKDGDIDLLATQTLSFEPALFHRNLAGVGAKPFFSAVLDLAGTSINLPHDNTTLEAVDWDSDGDLDLLRSGYALNWFENSAGPGKIPALKPLRDLGIGGLHFETADWDSDGDVDLIGIPRSCFGPPVQLLRNQAGSGQLPQFGPGVDLTTETGPLLDCGVGEVVDWDGDGALDLLIGKSRVNFYRNAAPGGEFPQLAPSVPLANRDGDLFVDGTPSLEASDWDADGDVDLIYLSQNQPRLVENTAADGGMPVLAPARSLEAALGPLTDGGPPDLADWDGDGDLDLLRTVDTGRSSNAVQFYENEAGPGLVPSFGPPVEALVDESRSYLQERPLAVDWDGDQDPDLLVSDGAYIRFYENIVGVGNVPVLVPAGIVQTTHGSWIESRSFNFDVVDWDNDADLDLLVGGVLIGSIKGIRLFENTAGAGRLPTLISKGFLSDPSGDIRCDECRIDVTDWDGDGDPDLLLGLKDVGTVQFFANSAESSELTLDAPVSLPSIQVSASLLSYLTLAPMSVDWDADGQQDLLVWHAGLYLYLSELPRPLLGLTKASADGVSLLWTPYQGTGFQRYEVYRSLLGIVEVDGLSGAGWRVLLSVALLGAGGLLVARKRPGLTWIFILGSVVCALNVGRAENLPDGSSCPVPEGFELIGTLADASTTVYQDTDVLPNGKYSYFLRTVTEGGCFTSNAVKAIALSRGFLNKANGSTPGKARGTCVKLDG